MVTFDVPAKRARWMSSLFAPLAYSSRGSEKASLIPSGDHSRLFPSRHPFADSVAVRHSIHEREDAHPGTPSYADLPQREVGPFSSWQEPFSIRPGSDQLMTL